MVFIDPSLRFLLSGFFLDFHISGFRLVRIFRIFALFSHIIHPRLLNFCAWCLQTLPLDFYYPDISDFRISGSGFFRILVLFSHNIRRWILVLKVFRPCPFSFFGYPDFQISCLGYSDFFGYCHFLATLLTLSWYFRGIINQLYQLQFQLSE